MDGSSDKTLLEPGEITIGDTVHIQEYFLQHEDDLTILRLLIVANRIGLLHERYEILRSLVFAYLLRCFLHLELLHHVIWVLRSKEKIAHLKVFWLGQVEHDVRYGDDVIAPS